MKRKITLLSLALFVSLVARTQTKEITILAVNDMHASIDRFPQFVALVDSMRTVYPDLILVSAGDNRTGNPANDMYPQPSYPMVALMNKAGFNLSVVGNHEFDGGIDNLRFMVNHSDFRFVCANMYAHDSLRLHIEPYRIFEIDGVRVGVLGLIQTGANGLPDAHPGQFKGVTFKPLDRIADQYSWLRNQCHVFVVLAHEDYDECAQLALQYPYADVMISGHTHYRVEGTDLHNSVMVTQADSHLKHVTHITLQVTDGEVTHKKARLLNVNAFRHKDPDVVAMVDSYNNNEMFFRELTQALTDFSSYEELGYLMTDAIRIETGADIALQNPGGVRISTLPKGPITVRQIYQLDPFGNEVIEFNLTGEEVLRLIEASYFAENKKPPYVSGITYKMELDPLGNIKELQVKLEDGSKLNLQRHYKVVLNSYLAAVAVYEKEDPGSGLFRPASDFTIEYLEKQPAVDYHGIKRITIQ